MAGFKLRLAPGINTMSTQAANEGGWSFGNLIRWQDGYLQKVGGWQKLTSNQFTGLSRGLHAFRDSDGNDYLVSGSSTALQVYFNGAIYTLDIYGVTNNLAVPFMTSSTLAPHLVIVTDTNANVSPGDKVYFNLPATVDDVCIFDGVYTVSGGGPTTYDITIPQTITSSDTDGGYPPQFAAGSASNAVVRVNLSNHGLSAGDIFTVNIATSVGGIQLFGGYEIIDHYGELSLPVAADHFWIAPGQNWIYAQTVYELQDSGGLPLGRISYATDIPANTDNWSLDNFGSALVACYQNGPVLVWNPPVTNTAATGIPNAPNINTGLFVAMPQAQVVTFGASVGNLQDPLLIAWSDAGNYTTWAASSTNQAGTFRLSRGSAIIGGRQAPQVSLIWTDLDLWSMQYVGTPFIYSFNIVQTGCGLIAQRAHAVLYGQTYWMSQKQFFTWGSGGVSVLQCAVWDNVFNDLDTNNLGKIWAWSNAAFNEIWWFYPSASGGTGEVDSYVNVNVLTRAWSYGSLKRTSGIDQSVLGTPISIDEDRYIQQHEQGYDDDTEPMDGAFAETGFIEIADGAQILFVDQMIPDFKWFGSNGTLKLTVYAKSYPADPGINYGPYTINPQTRFISLRQRARFIAFKIEWAPIKGFSARLGAVGYRGAPAGSRP